ncbi:hypothetical protein [Polaromonas sp.]|uniref:hypothetical protein n=1 Tax=Polaromonas sp. TaxID=1869339 RepID=UPI0032672549
MPTNPDPQGLSDFNAPAMEARADAHTDKTELRGLVPASLAQALDALAFADDKERHAYVTKVLEAHVEVEIHKTIMRARMLRGNPRYTESTGVHRSAAGAARMSDPLCPFNWQLRKDEPTAFAKDGRFTHSANAARINSMKRGMAVPTPLAHSINTEKQDRAQRPKQKARAL